MKTLHIGNIANNAYLAARKERSLGIDAHVISVDYTHIMGFPEWEEVNMSKPASEHFSGLSELLVFPRPDWFHAGSWGDVYIQLFPNDPESTSKFKFSTLPNRFQNFIWKRFRNIFKKLIPLKYRAFVVGNLLHFIRINTIPVDILRNIVDSFDYVTLYGPSTSLAIYLPNRKLIALEHGTLRDFVDAKYSLAVDTRSGFEASMVVLITNQDCLPKAKIMNLNNPIATPHPIKDEDFASLLKIRLTHIQSNGWKKKFLVPARHTIPLDIDVGKGSNIIYEAIERISNMNPEIAFELVEWGDSLALAKSRLAHLEATGQVHWNELLSRPLLKRMMSEAVGVIDQLKIPAYGAITADALGLGVPVITCHSCENDINFFGECAPVVKAYDVDSLVAAILQVSNMSVAEQIENLNRNNDWFNRFLSSDISHKKRMEAYGIIDSLVTAE